MMTGDVKALHLSTAHVFSKQQTSRIELETGLGVVGDCHAGVTVQHRSRVAKDPSQPNLRQVHLIHAELLVELAAQGFQVKPGDLGENITVLGIDLLGLPQGTRLEIGATAEIEITGLRNPCKQINDFQDGLMPALLGRAEDGSLIRKAGVMAVVLHGGEIEVGAKIVLKLPAQPWQALEPV